MNKFHYGMQFYLTMLHQADKSELRRLDLSGTQRKALVERQYNLQWTPNHPHHLAQYQFEETVVNGKSTVKETFLHTPELEQMAWTENVRLAAHEANHSLRQKWRGVKAKQSTKKAGYLLGGLGAFKTWGLVGYALDTAALGTILGVGAGIVLGVPYAIKSMIAFHDEKKAYHHDESVACILQPNHKTLDEIKREKEAILDRRGFGEKLNERFIKAYPSSSKIDLIRLEAREKSMLNASTALYDPRRINALRDATQKNIINRTFSIYDIN